MERKLVVFLILFASFSLVLSSLAYYLQARPASEEFIAWGVYSPSGSLSGYFSGQGANVTVGETLSWHFVITNDMGSIQFIQVVYRLSNSSYVAPNATYPASAPELGNESIFVPTSQNTVLNLTWSVSSGRVAGELKFLNMTINGIQVSPPVGAVGGQRFRFFFELWTYDSESGKFLYGYKGQSGRVGAPLQVWFNVAG